LGSFSDNALQLYHYYSLSVSLAVDLGVFDQPKRLKHWNHGGVLKEGGSHSEKGRLLLETEKSDRFHLVIVIAGSNNRDFRIRSVDMRQQPVTLE
jgi:hypothetical protein